MVLKRQKKDKKAPRKPMDTFVCKDKKRDYAKEVEVMVKNMDDLARETDIAIARAWRSLEELRKELERV